MLTALGPEPGVEILAGLVTHCGFSPRAHTHLFMCSSSRRWRGVVIRVRDSSTCVCVCVCFLNTREAGFAVLGLHTLGNRTSKREMACTRLLFMFLSRFFFGGATCQVCVWRERMVDQKKKKKFGLHGGGFSIPHTTRHNLHYLIPHTHAPASKNMGVQGGRYMCVGTRPRATFRYSQHSVEKSMHGGSGGLSGIEILQTRSARYTIG